MTFLSSAQNPFGHFRNGLIADLAARHIMVFVVINNTFHELTEFRVITSLKQTALTGACVRVRY